jgi:hypothetical protein
VKSSSSVDEQPAKYLAGNKQEKSVQKESTSAATAPAAPLAPAGAIPAAPAAPAVAPDLRGLISAAEPDAEIFIPDGADQRPASRVFINSVAPVLEHLCEMTADRGPTSFDGVKPPPIDLQQYIQRLYSYIPCSSHCFVFAIIYVDRVLRANPRFKLSDLNVHRTFFTALVVASKFYDDEYYSNSWYGRVGGVNAKELNLLEVSFLKLIQFRLAVTPQEYEMYLTSVERACSNDSEANGERPKAADAEVSSSAASTAASTAGDAASTDELTV